MVVTKSDVYEKVIFAKRPLCPHCGQAMKIWECPDAGLSCGSGWGTPYLFVCLNDECPAFVKGWASMKREYGRTCSYRCICYPNLRTTEMMMVFSSTDCRAGIIDEAVVAESRAKGTPEDPDVQKLIRYGESRDVKALLDTLCDEDVYYKVRQKAAELIGELGLLETIEFLQNEPFKDRRILTTVRNAVKTIHEINQTQECPYCAEIIEVGATTCQHCGRDLSGVRT
jgi:hypothetical protein